MLHAVAFLASKKQQINHQSRIQTCEYSHYAINQPQTFTDFNQFEFDCRSSPNFAVNSIRQILLLSSYALTTHALTTHALTTHALTTHALTTHALSDILQ